MTAPANPTERYIPTTDAETMRQVAADVRVDLDAVWSLAHHETERQIASSGSGTGAAADDGHSVRVTHHDIRLHCEAGRAKLDTLMWMIMAGHDYRRHIYPTPLSHACHA